MRTAIALAVAAVATAVGAASISASPGDSVRLVTSNHWQGITFVTGLESCNLLGDSVFRDVDLTDEINITYVLDQGNYIVNGGASFHGVITTPSGRYTVAGHSVETDGMWPLLGPFIGTGGRATISGPNGTVTGEARFQDLTGWPPPEFDILFTGITSCHLR
jgi:hypothetical protein